MKEEKNVKKKNIEENKKETQDQDEPPSWLTRSSRKIVLDIETTNRSVTTGRLVAVGVMEVDTGITRVFFDRDEKTMLKRFIHFFDKQGFQEIIAFDIDFNTRFIVGKCLQYNIKMDRFNTARYNDVFKTVKSIKNTFTYNQPFSLHGWARFIFGESQILKNAFVPQLFEKGQINQIIEYTKQNVELVFKIWQRVNSVLGTAGNKEKCTAKNTIGENLGFASQQLPLASSQCVDHLGA